MRIHGTFLTALTLLLSAPVQASPAFEPAAGDVKALLRDFRAARTAVEAPAPLEAAPLNIAYDVDCNDVVFEADSPAVSPAVRLFTRTWIEECERIPVPGGGCIPRRRQIRTDDYAVRVEIVGRVVPGPREAFRACLAGPWLSLKTLSSPFQYDVAQKDGYFTLKRK